MNVFSVQFLMVSLVATLAFGEPMRNGHVEVELIPEVEKVAPGTTFWAGVRLRMDPGWHTYWMNPGDTGLQTDIEWLPPDGITIGPILWPCPEKIEAPPSFSYGFLNEVILLVKVTASRELKPGTLVNLAGRVKWLVCEDKCIAGSADISWVIPVENKSVRNDQSAAELAEARQLVPQPTEEWHFQAISSGDRIILYIKPPDTFHETIKDLYFFPSELEVLDHAAEQSIAEDGRGPRLILKRSPYAEAEPKQLRGVLRINNNSKTAIAVDEPVNKAYAEGQ